MIGQGARFGLDVGRGGVKLVRWAKDGVRGAERRLPPELSGPERRAAARAAIAEVAAELGVGRRPVHVAVPRAEAIVKVSSVPRVPDAELERVVRFQAARDLPFELEQVVLAWGRLQAPAAGGPGDAAPTAAPAGGADELAFAAVRRETLDDLRALVEEAGLRVGSLEVSTQAAARALALLGPADQPEVVLAEVGRTTSDLLVLERGRLVFSRSASVGCGPREGEPDGPSAPGEGGWVDRLALEVSRTLGAARQARGADRTGPPDAVLVAGGGAAAPALAAALESRVGVSPRVLDGLAVGPAGEAPAGAGEDPGRGARFVVARGLADPRPVPGVPSLDLAHWARGEADRRGRLRGGVVAALALALGVAGYAATKAAIDARRAQLEEVQAEREALAPRVVRARALEAELELAERWGVRKGRELEVMLAVSRALDGKRVFLTRLRWTDGKAMNLAGRARDWDEVGRFLVALEGEPLVRRVSLDGIRRAEARGGADAGEEFDGTAELDPGGLP